MFFGGRALGGGGIFLGGGREGGVEGAGPVGLLLDHCDGVQANQHSATARLDSGKEH